MKFPPNEILKLQDLASLALQQGTDPEKAIHDLYALAWGALLRAARERPGGLCAGLSALWDKVSDQQIAPASVAEALRIAEVDPLLLVLHSGCPTGVDGAAKVEGTPDDPSCRPGVDPDKDGWSMVLPYNRELIEEVGAPHDLVARLTHRRGPDIYRPCGHRGSLGLDLAGLASDEVERIRRVVRIPSEPLVFDRRLEFASWSPLKNLERAGFPPIRKILAHARLLRYGWEMDNDVWLIEFADGSRKTITTNHGHLVEADRSHLEAILAETLESACEIQHFLTAAYPIED